MRRAAGGLDAPEVAGRRLWLADVAGGQWRLFSFALQRCLVQRGLVQRGLPQLLPLGGKGRRDAAAPLIFEVVGVLLVDPLLLLRRGVGARDVEVAVLHEIEIGVAAAGFAAAGK